jgi:hypothetical protein
MTTDLYPILLPCGHSFCKSCISMFPVFGGHESSCTHEEWHWFKKVSKTVRRVQGGHILCLYCREKVELGEEGVDGLEFNSYLALAADRLEKKITVCAECERSTTCLYCKECSMYLCSPCCSRIHSGAITGKHNIGNYDKFHLTESSTVVKYCSAHGKEECLLYCTTCQILACVLCAYGNHKKHNISLLADAAEELRNKLKLKANMVTIEASKIDISVSKLENELMRLNDNSMKSRKFVSESFDRILSLMYETKEEMLDQIDQTVTEKKQKMIEQLNNLKCVSRDLILRATLSNNIILNTSSSEMVEHTNHQSMMLDVI